jgi:transposase
MGIYLPADGDSRMPALKYRVTLTEDEKAELDVLLRKGKSAARKQTRARILLKAAAGSRDEEIVQALGVSASWWRGHDNGAWRRGWNGVEGASAPGSKAELTDRQAAHLIAIACSEAPDGHDHWTLRLLADQVVKLEYAESCRHEAIRQLLKKHPQALAAPGMVHSQGRRGVHRRDGGRAGSV